MFAGLWSQLIVFGEELRRNKFQTVFSLIFFMVLFIGFLLVNNAGKSNETVNILIFHFLTWSLYNSVFSTCARSIKDDVGNRLVESILLLPIRYTTLIFLRTFSRFPYDALVLIFVLTVVTVLFKLQIDFFYILVSTLFSFALAFPAVLGISLCFSGVVIRFKWAGILSLVGAIVLSLLTYLSFKGINIWFILVPLREFDVHSLLITILSSFAIFLFGLLTFNWFIHSAKKEGTTLV